MQKILTYKNMKFFVPCFLAAIFLTAGTAAAQQKAKKIENPKIVLNGELKAAKDYFGRQRFSGKVQNSEKERIDFINIEFTMKNREGKTIGTVKHFIKGKFHQFQDFQISMSSLEAGQVGTFVIITHVPADSVYKYDYKIKGTHFIFP